MKKVINNNSKRRFISISIFLCIIFSIIVLLTVPEKTWANSSEINSPVGNWKVIHDKTGRLVSVIKIWKESDGSLKGRIEKFFPKPGKTPNPVCKKCSGEKKNQPVVGLECMWGFKGSGSHWENGKVLDPESGRVYSCQMDVFENGQKLKVFGYVQLIFKIGKSLVWVRDLEE